MLICILYKFPLFIRGSVSLEVTQRFLSYKESSGKKLFFGHKKIENIMKEIFCAIYVY